MAEAGLTPGPDPEDVDLRAADGVRLRGRLWRAPGPRAVAIVAHGFGEHGGSHDGLARWLVADPGCDVLAVDFRGHGRSDGKRGVVREHADLDLDLRAALAWAIEHRPALPRFVVAHSNGGLVALRTVLDGGPEVDGLAGLVLANPPIRVTARVPAWKRAVGRILLRVAPGITLDSGIPEGHLSADPAAIAGYRADPLRHTRIGPAYFFGMLAAGPALLARAGSVRVPTLVLLGGADPLVDPAAGMELYDRLGSADRSVEVFPGLRHELYHEAGREAALAAVARWIGERSAIKDGPR